MNRVKEGSGWEFLLKIRPRAFTWNPASGCSILDCAVRKRGVCWAKKIVKRLGQFCCSCPTFKPHLHPNRFDEPFNMKTPSVITPVSTGDLFGLGSHKTTHILSLMRKAPWHIYAILTKAPHNAHYVFPDNVWFGVTVNEQNDWWRLRELQKVRASVKWVIFEPLYSAIDYDLTFLDWIILGSQSRPTLQPEKAWIQSILDNALDVPIFMKSTLEWNPKKRESPKGVV